MAIHFADGTSFSTATLSGAGKILQVQTDIETSHTSCTPDSQLVFKDIPLSKAITPSSTSSQILVSFTLFGETSNNSRDHYFRVKRAISGGSTSFITAADQGNRTGTLLIGAMGLESSGGTTPTIITMTNLLKLRKIMEVVQGYSLIYMVFITMYLTLTENIIYGIYIHLNLLKV